MLRKPTVVRTMARRALASSLVAIALAACRSSDDRTGGSSGAGSDAAAGSGAASEAGALSTSDLIAQADGICEDTAARIQAEPAPTSLPAIRQTLETAARITTDGVAKLEALIPPAPVRADYAALLERFRAAARQAQTAADAAKTGEISGVIGAMGSLEGDSESRRLARRIGLRKCRSGSGSLLPPGASGLDVPSPPASP